MHTQISGIFLAFLSVGWMLAIASGCASYSQKTNQTMQAWQQGNPLQALESISYASLNNDKKSSDVLFLLEEGSIARAAHKYDRSTEVLAKAEDKIEYYDSQPEITIREEIKALAINQSFTEYRAYHYDRIMMNTYQALNQLMLASRKKEDRQSYLDRSRVEWRKAYFRQREAVEENAEAIANAQKANQSVDEYDVEKTLNESVAQRRLSRIYAHLENRQAYKDIVNPFTSYMMGLFYLFQGENSSDLEFARTALGNAYKMHPENPYLARDAELAENIASGEKAPDLLYLIFETGRAPSREQAKISLPLFLFNNEVDYVGMAFPRLKFHPDYLKSIEIRAGQGWK
mgnify:CR=1 FL=1